VPGRLGRGGAGPAAVYQWLASNPVLLGVASAAAWEGMKRAGKSLVGLLRRAKTRWSATKIHVSRGAAALIAADTIARLEVGSHPFLIEAVEEPTSIAGVTSPELNFVGIEPWLVFLVDLEGGVRWIIAVSSAGQVVGQMRIPLQELEASHYPVEG